MWKTIITRNTGTQETRGDEDYKLKPKQNHCYGHTPQIQKGAKTSNSGVERMPFVTGGRIGGRSRELERGIKREGEGGRKRERGRERERESEGERERE